MRPLRRPGGGARGGHDRYLAQIATTLTPATVDAADLALRQLTGWLCANTDITSAA